MPAETITFYEKTLIPDVISAPKGDGGCQSLPPCATRHRCTTFQLECTMPLRDRTNSLTNHLMIESLYVQNFRCLEAVTLDLKGRSSALLLGKNGAGKSTIRQALTVFQKVGRESNRAGSVISRTDFSFYNDNRPMRFEVVANFGGDRYEYAIGFDWPSHFREPRINDEILKINGQDFFKRQQSQIMLLDGGSFNLDWHVFALPVIADPRIEASAKKLKDYFASLMLISPQPSAMSGYSENASNELAADASDFAACLRGLLESKPKAYTEFDKYVRTVFPDFSSFENEDRGPNGKQLMIEFKAADSPRTLKVAFESLSDGEKCFFLSGYLVASTAVGNPVTCLWDEADNHLSIAEVGQFIATLQKLGNRGGQFIATSHHPETIRSFTDRTTYVLSRPSRLDPTRIRSLEEVGYHGDLINALTRDEVIGQP
ncbi:MAG: AAA family ATPase [Tepidisphaeraceae bacterium]